MLQSSTQIKKSTCFIVQLASFSFHEQYRELKLFLSISIPFVCKGSGTLRTEVMQIFFFFMCVEPNSVKNYNFLTIAIRQDRPGKFPQRIKFVFFESRCLHLAYTEIRELMSHLDRLWTAGITESRTFKLHKGQSNENRTPATIVTMEFVLF